MSAHKSMPTTGKSPLVRSWLSAASRDDGIALATVAAISAIMFLLATTLVMLATQEQVSASNQLQRSKALQAADAGLNAYIYQLSRNSYYATTNPTLSGSTADASWTVLATPPPLGSALTSITVAGSIVAQNGSSAVTRRVQATVRPGSFSDYMMDTNNAITLGANGTIKGSLLSNTSIDNFGTITQNAYAPTYSAETGSVLGGTKYTSTTNPAFSPLQFATVDFGVPSTVASGDGPSYWYPDSGSYTVAGKTRHYWGYQVVLGGMGGTVSKIQSVSTTSGLIITDPSTTASFTVPAHGVMYFKDSIWVSGTYSYRLSLYADVDREESAKASTTASNTGPSGYTAIGSTSSPANGSVFLYNNLQSADPSNSAYVLGIVTSGDISFTSEYPTTVTPDSLTIQAAMLSSNGSIHADQTPNITKAYIKVLGSESSYDSPYIQTTSGSTVVSGIRTRDYWYDYNLDSSVPPYYPTSNQGLKIKSWIEK